MLLRVSIGNVKPVGFVGHAPHDGEGYVIDPEGFQGWDDGTDVRRDEQAIPSGHGSFDVPGYLSPRVVSLSGNAIADSPQRLDWLRDQLTGLLAHGDSARIQAEHQGKILWSTCRLASKTKFVTSGADPTTAAFQIQLWCPNPRKYGDTRAFASGAAAFHYGNFKASPIIVVTPVGAGMPSGYTINGPSGRKYTVSAALTAGHTHVIDMATGLIRVDGVVTAGIVTQPDTWSIPSGQQVTMTLVPVSGAGTMTAEVVDTYV